MKPLAVLTLLIATEFQVNTYTTSNQYNPAICCDPAGNFVVVWASSGQDGSSSGVFGQRYEKLTDTPTATPTDTPTATTTPTETPTATPTNTPAPTGAPCTSDSQCASEMCTDGVCCNERCAAPDQLCNLQGSVGTCTDAVAPAPTTSRPGLLIGLGVLAAIAALAL